MASIINASSSGSGGLISTGDASGQLELQANGSTKLTVSASGVNMGGLAFPTTDGTNGQFLQTNGSGTLSFSTPSGGFSNLAVLTSGTSWTAPAGVSKIKVIVTGGGGGGSGAGNAAYRTGSGGAVYVAL